MTMQNVQNEADRQILIVDDDVEGRRLLARSLASAGFDCREADGGLDALKQLRSEQPSLLLLDFKMPGLDGAELLKQLRSDPDSSIAQIPAIMLTGYGESEVLCLE